MIWILSGILFLLYATKGVWPGFQPFLRIGSAIEMDWRDIIALLVVGIVIYGLAKGDMSAKDVVTILGSVLVGKSISA